MKKKGLNLEEFFEESGMMKRVFSERSGVSLPVLNKVLKGYDYNMSTAKKIVEASNNTISPSRLLEAIKPKEERQSARQVSQTSQSPKKKKTKR